MLIAVVFVVCGATTCAVRADEDTTAAMGEIFQNMRYLLPLSVGDDWNDPQPSPVRRAHPVLVAGRSSRHRH